MSAVPYDDVAPISEFASLSAGAELRLIGNDLLLGYGVGAAVGTFVAYRRRQRDPDTDVFMIVTRWSAVTVAAAGVATALRLG